VADNIVGPFDTAASDNRFTIPLADYYSKCPEVSFSHSVSTDLVVSFLSVFNRHGNPLTK